MAHRSIGQERFGFGGRARSSSSLDALVTLIDWSAVTALLDPLYPATKGEPAWPPLAMFKALLLSIWYDLSDVKLAEALDDRASFRRFCGFSANEGTPERTAFVRYRRLLVAQKLDGSKNVRILRCHGSAGVGRPDWPPCGLVSLVLRADLLLGGPFRYQADAVRPSSHARRWKL
ncbi:transposase [Sphingobium sp. AS12]|uniref:transposase n=1 Tax=Sphingobium sp. AS12 TaxID=2849495 RepID=UPI001C31B9B7|nr:transposase [Sphingobium sp. AS12]